MIFFPAFGKGSFIAFDCIGVSGFCIGFHFLIASDSSLALILSHFSQLLCCFFIGLGKWGRMRKEYLRLANPVLFSDMVLNETLYEHCAEIEETAKKRMEIIVPQLAKAYGVTEQLKAENQIEWVRQMNACVAQAEEAIKGELIYC